MPRVYADLAISADGFSTGPNQREDAPFGDIEPEVLHNWMFEHADDHRPEIDAILSHFHLSQDEAEDLLREILLLVVHRWDGIDSREIWLLATIRRACLRQIVRNADPAAGRR